MALLLLPIGQCELLAQQAAYYGQYAPTRQSGYAQQCGSMQAQTYGQPSYAPQTLRSYPQQANSISNQIYPQQNYAQTQPTAQPLNARRLEQLVAPIALYPDTLVAQGMAPEFVNSATEKMKRINAAYDEVSKMRGIK